jgi:hypothetical protein
MRSGLLAVVLFAAFTGCGSPSRPSAGSTEHARVALPPEQAAACFARNAEEHSSALVAEVRPGRDRAEVVVRVKNGVLYGTADFERAGTGSAATLYLNVTTSGRRSDLVDSLLEGC